MAHNKGEVMSVNLIIESNMDNPSELHYKVAYLRLFGAVAGLSERIETAGIRMSLADVRGALEQAMQDAEEAACAD